MTMWIIGTITKGRDAVICSEYLWKKQHEEGRESRRKRGSERAGEKMEGRVRKDKKGGG